MGLKPWQIDQEQKINAAVANAKENFVRFMVNDPNILDVTIAAYLKVPVSKVPAIRKKYRNS